MPIIDVSMLEGRSRERKAELIAALTDAAERVLGVPRESIRVLLREVPHDSWGVGGRPLSSGAAEPRPQAPSGVGGRAEDPPSE